MDPFFNIIQNKSSGYTPLSSAFCTENKVPPSGFDKINNDSSIRMDTHPFKKFMATLQSDKNVIEEEINYGKCKKFLKGFDDSFKIIQDYPSGTVAMMEREPTKQRFHPSQIAKENIEEKDTHGQI